MKCYYHSKDLDGFASGAIMKLKYPDAEFIGYDYGEPFEMSPGEDIILADVSLPMPMMDKVAQLSNSFVWIDHHKSAINEFNEYYGDRAHQITPVLQDGIAACEIAWEYFFPDEPMPQVIKLLGEYDTWRNGDKKRWFNEILPFQYGMRLNCNSLETFPMNLFAFDETRSYIIEGMTVLRYQQMQNEIHCRSAFEAEFKGHRAICLNTQVFNSQTFKSVYDEEKHDIMMPFGFDGDKWRVSLYTTKDIDCSAIAKSMGGGGHKKAAGFKVGDIASVFTMLKS